MDGLRHAYGKAQDWQTPESGQVDREDAESQRVMLARIIEGEIIPRLMMSHRVTHTVSGPIAPGQQPLLQLDVAGFAKLVVREDLRVASTYVSVLRSAGRSVESILLDLFGPTARHLGELWEADLCDFVDVTMGLARLQQLLRDISPVEPTLPDYADHSRSIVLAPGPGEKHTFGLSIVEEFFKLAGWEVRAGAAKTASDAVELARVDFVAVVGFSLSSELRIEDLVALIKRVRRESCNPFVCVMVGGPLFLSRPDLANQIGADATAHDGATAVLRAQNLLITRARAC